MSKKNDVKKEEVALVEAPAVDKKKPVSVEMSQEQLDEFVAFKAKKAEEKDLLETPAPEPVKWYQLVLLYEHNINGKKYGPGKADIPDYHLGTVMQGENMSRQQEIRLNTTSNRMFKIMDSGQAVPVAVNSVKV